MGCEEEALKEVETAKQMIRSKDYKGARATMREAMDRFPDLENGPQMLNVCEILVYGDIELPNYGIDWYWLLQLLPSSTEANLKNRCEELIQGIEFLQNKKFPGTNRALKLIREAMSVLCNQAERCEFDRKRKASGYFGIPTVSPIKKPRRSSETLNKGNASIQVNDITEDLEYSLLSSSFREAIWRLDDLPFRMSSSNSILNQSFCWSSELRSLRSRVFGALPQNPHYLPLAMYTGDVREGMKLGLDVAFLTLSEKIRGLVDPQHFCSELECFTAELYQLEDMGYDVRKLRERLDKLRGITECDRASRDEIAKLEGEAKVKEAEVSNVETRILELEVEIEKSRALVTIRKSEIETLQSKATKQKEDSSKIVSEFASMSQSMWT